MDWDDFPVFLGQGSLHTLSDDARPERPRILGPNGRPLERKPDAPRPIGFHTPRRAR